MEGRNCRTGISLEAESCGFPVLKQKQAEEAQMRERDGDEHDGFVQSQICSSFH